MNKTCETCGQRVRVEGKTTMHYVGVDAEERELLAEERDELREKLERAREGLRFYADPGNWALTGDTWVLNAQRTDTVLIDRRTEIESCDTEDIVHNGNRIWCAGKTARKVLEEIGDE